MVLKMFWLKQYEGIVRPCLLLLLLLLPQSNAFIVPQELPSLLSVIYSNIPPIKKGTDSRLGFGFRLGDHADFQVLVELGPQKETKPVGEPSKDDQSFNKRQVSETDQRALLRQQLKQQIREQQKELESQMFLTSTERNAANWLESWSNGMKPQKPYKTKPTKTKITKPVTNPNNLLLPTKPQMAQNAMQQLQMLYKMATSSSTTTTQGPPLPYKDGSLSLGIPSGFRLPPPALTQDTNTLGPLVPNKTKAEITRELMDVSLESP